MELSRQRARFHRVRDLPVHSVRGVDELLDHQLVLLERGEVGRTCRGQSIGVGGLDRELQSDDVSGEPGEVHVNHVGHQQRRMSGNSPDARGCSVKDAADEARDRRGERKQGHKVSELSDGKRLHHPKRVATSTSELEKDSRAPGGKHAP